MYLPAHSSDEQVIGLVISVPEPWASQLTDRRIALGDPLGEKVPAHITLLPPTTIRNADYEDVLSHLRAVASRHHPFKLRVEGADTFRPISAVAYLKITQGFNELTALEDDLCAGVLDVPKRFPYHPHVTLAQQVDDGILDEALAFGETFEAEWTVKGFRLDQVGDDGTYHSRALFSFDPGDL